SLHMAPLFTRVRQPLGSLTHLHLPSFVMNLTRRLETGDHLATFTWKPGSGPYTLHTKSTQVVVSVLALLPPSLSPPCTPCVEGRQCAAPHSSTFPPTTTPQMPHMDDLRVLRLLFDRGGGFASGLLEDLCCEEGITQSFTLPASPQKNGITERRIGLIIEVARTSMIHVAAPHFLSGVHLPLSAILPRANSLLALFAVSSLAFLSTRLTNNSTTQPRAVSCTITTSPLTNPLPHPRPAPSDVSQATPPLLKVYLDTSGPAEGGDPIADNIAASHCPPRLETPPRFPPRPSSPSLQPAAVDLGAIGGGEFGGAGTGGAGSGVADSGGMGSGGADLEGTVSGGAEHPHVGGVEGPAAGGSEGAGGGDTGARGVGGSGAGGIGAGGPSVGGSGAGGARGSGNGGSGARGARRSGAGGSGAGGVLGACSWSALHHLLGLHLASAEPSTTSTPPPLLFPRPDLSQSQLPPDSSLPVPPLYTPLQESTSRPTSPVARTRRARRSVVLLLPPPSSLPNIPDTVSDCARAASPTVTRCLATLVTDPTFLSAAASALVAELTDFAATCRLDYLPSFVSDSAHPASVRGELALGCDILEDRQFDLEYLAAALTDSLVLLHVAAQHDYEPHSLDFLTAFLQDSLHEEMWLCRPPGFTGSFPEGTQWSLRRPIYGLRQAPREWHDTLRTNLAALGFAPSTADPTLFLRTHPSRLPFYILVYVNDLVFASANSEALALVKAEL
ncbi:unnamed protein product, partial [Closterium sp. NIES-53]